MAAGGRRCSRDGWHQNNHLLVGGQGRLGMGRPYIQVPTY